MEKRGWTRQWKWSKQGLGNNRCESTKKKEVAKIDRNQPKKKKKNLFMYEIPHTEISRK